MNLADILKDQINAMNNCTAAGIRAGVQMERVKVSAILAAYDRAIQDPNTKLPSYLMAAIEAARYDTRGASPFEDRRREPRTNETRDGDMTTWGTPLKEGA